MGQKLRHYAEHAEKLMAEDEEEERSGGRDAKGGHNYAASSLVQVS